MRVGIIGPRTEPHCARLAAALSALGAEPVQVEASNFDLDHVFELDETRAVANGDGFEDVGAFFLRSILSPVPEVFVEDGAYKLYEDWHQSYMLSREKHGFLLSWLLALLAQGKTIVNPPHLGTISLLKPYQMFRLKQLGFPTPHTLVTNDPERARDFVNQVGKAVCKPPIGGAFCERVTEDTLARLPLIAKSPVIFQEELPGQDIRVTAVRDRILSAVSIESDQVDFRATAAYDKGEEVYTPVQLPPDVAGMCLRAMEASDLLFSGIDLRKVGPDRYVFIELNFSPAFAAIESKSGHAITEGLARFLIERGQQAPLPTNGPSGAPTRRQTFFDYGLPRPKAT